MRRIPPKTPILKDPVDYDLILQERPWCQACGVSSQSAPFAPHCGGVPLSRHHIVKFKRSDDRTNILVLCHRDHQLAEGASIRDPRTRLLLPRLTLGICLSLKKLRDPREYDEARLTELYGRALPDLEPIPKFLLNAWASSSTRKRSGLGDRPEGSEWEEF